MTLDQLLVAYGNVNAIPPEQLELEGFVQYRGKIVPIDELDENQLIEALGIQELRDETEESKLMKKIRLVQQKIRESFKGDLGNFLTEEDKTKLVSDVERWANLAQKIYADFFKVVDDIEMKYIPHIKLVEVANEFLGKRDNHPPYAKEALHYLVNRFIDSDSVRSLEAKRITLRDFVLNDEEYLAGMQETIAEGIRLGGYQEYRQEFEGKYGVSANFGFSVPFWSYLLRKTLLKEEEPQEFLGMNSLLARKNLIQKFQTIPDIELLADNIYEDGFSEYSSRISGLESGGYYGERRKSDSLEWKLAISDVGSGKIQKFEERRDEEGVAIAYAGTSEFYVDEPMLREGKLREVLIAVHEAEFGPVKRCDEIENYEYLGKFIRSQSMKKKVARLANQSKSFKRLIQARSEGNAEYIDSLPENQTVGEQLQDFGINTDTFYNGIGKAEFIISGGKTISRDQIRGEKISVFKDSLEKILSSDIIYKPARLQQKIVDELKKEDNYNPKEGVEFVDYMASLDDKEISKVASITAEYISQKQNTKNQQEAVAISYHMHDVNRFMKRKRDKRNGNDLANTYGLRLATKDPFTDADIGNDGGCCIGVYEGSDFDDAWNADNFVKFLKGEFNPSSDLPPVDGNGIYMPFYLKDRATQFVEIFRGDQREGMALMFAGKNERDEPVLLVNSIELSEKLRRDGNRDYVIRQAIDYIKNYAKQSGFENVVMGRRSYNPSVGYVGGDPGFKEFQKIHPWDEDFYSDVLSREGVGRGGMFGSI
jgi:hypothetical protein